jgi:hypothetical protein
VLDHQIGGRDSALNRQDAYTAEREQIEQQLGYYVPLDRAADMIKTAQKIVTLISGYSYSVSYKEARMILRLADKSLQEISGGIE